jgi:hypothetical protein
MTPPSCTIEEIVDLPDPATTEIFDRELGNILSKYEGNAEDFLVVALGYLQRKTNFFKEGDPQKRVLEAFRKVS